jgi:tetratricopeptide (TPR) repeat protein
VADRIYRIFLSSPADVRSERDRVQLVIDRINAEMQDGPVFSLTRWEESYYSATADFQDQILSPGKHDLVVFIFWKRLGTELPPAYNRADGASRTGTEYEFEEARDAREHSAEHLPDILVYRKTAKILYHEETVDIERAQKKALDQFWERWFRSDTGHFIAGFQSFADLAAFETQVDLNLREWLKRRNPANTTWDIARRGSPYRGLVPFDEVHADLFFGRSIDLMRARARFIEAAIGQETGRRGTPFLLILGPSGCGKSSFMRAGLLPKMRVSGVPAFLGDGSDAIQSFRCVTFVPHEMGADLCAGFAKLLYQPPTDHKGDGLEELSLGDYPDVDAFAELVKASAKSACVSIARALDRAGDARSPAAATGAAVRLGLLVAIDQMEELFARTDEDRAAFFNLLAVLAGSGRIWFAATMRSDFYERLRLEPALRDLADRGRLFDLSPPKLADYRDIVRLPALAAGLQFETSESRDLGTEIEVEAGSDGALPMVEFLLEQLFRERRGNLMLLETYDRLGGAAGALAEQGERTLEGLPSAVQAEFPRVVRRLVRKSTKDTGATAAPAPMSAFPPESAERLLIEALAGARLVQAFSVHGGSESSTSWVRWSHEALLDRWPRLRDIVANERRDYETLDHLERGCALWRNANPKEKDGRLLRELSLAEASDLLKRWDSDLDRSIQEYVRASQLQDQARRRRRRRHTVAIVSTLSILLVLATIAGMVALKQRNLARRERLAADRTSEFMVSLFKLADPGENRGDSITVREVLDRGSNSVTESLEQEPAIRADLLTAMGEAYSGLGLYESSEKVLSKALDDQVRASAVASDSRIKTLDASGSTYYLAGDYEHAAKNLRQAADLARRDLPADSVLRSTVLVDLADVQVQLEKYAEAEVLCQEALAADRTRAPTNTKQLARTLDTLGIAYMFSGDLVNAEKTLREALAAHIKASGARDAATAQAMNNLAAALYEAGKYDENSALLQQALPVYRKVFGADHPEVATLLNNMGRALLMAGHMDEATPLFRQALAIDEKRLGPAHDDLVPPLNSLAMIDLYNGHIGEAQAELDRAERIARLPDHGALLDQVLLNAADLAIVNGQWEKASTLLEESKRLLKAAHPLNQHSDDAWRYAVADTLGAQLLAHQGDVSGAQRLLAASTPIITQRFGQSGFYSQLARRRTDRVQQISQRAPLKL